MNRFLLTLTLCGLTFVGCQEPAAEPDDTTTTAAEDDHGHDHGHDHGDHAHPTEGPHHGDLVELGNEEYHGEVVHDDEASTVTVYILDGSATKQVAIEASEVTVNVSHAEAPQQFTLAAVPDDGDADGRSSRFVSNEQELMKHLDDHAAKAQLVVKIDGKSYRGDIHHSHDHEDPADHDHAH